MPKFNKKTKGKKKKKEKELQKERETEFNPSARDPSALKEKEDLKDLSFQEKRLKILANALTRLAEKAEEESEESEE